MPRERKTVEPARLERMPVWIQAILIAGACFAAYQASVAIGFLCDDFAILNAIKNGYGLMTNGVFFRPFAILTFRIDWLLAHENAGWYHLVNIILHYASSIGVMVFAARLIRKPYAGLVAGLVFAIHPALPEAVSWISGRFDVLCGALLIWSFVCYDIQRNESGFYKIQLLIISMVLFILACLSKEQAFIFPLVLGIYETLPIDREGGSEGNSRRAMRVMSYFAIAILLFILRWVWIGGLGGYLSREAGVSQVTFFLNQAAIRPFEILFNPLNHAISSEARLVYKILIAAIFLSPLLFIFRSRTAVLIFCVLGIIVNMLPTAMYGVNIDPAFQNGRFLYISAMFFAMLIASLLTSGKPNSASRIAAMLVLVYLATSLIVQNQNNHAWVSAGTVVRSAVASSDRLIENRRGEWGSTVRELIVYNVPRDHLGAWTFGIGFPAMLKFRHGAEFEGVEIEVVHHGEETAGEFERMEDRLTRERVVWLYVEADKRFTEYY